MGQWQAKHFVMAHISYSIWQPNTVRSHISLQKLWSPGIVCASGGLTIHIWTPPKYKKLIVQAEAVSRLGLIQVLALDMSTDRSTMEKVLKEHCVPLLKEHGFKGGFPNLYRDTEGFVSLINFQFYSSGGSFCVNLSFADKQRENIYFRPETEPKNLRVSQTRIHARLGAPKLKGDHWFSFGKTSYDEYRGAPQSPTDIAAEINQLIELDALPWWGKYAAQSQPFGQAGPSSGVMPHD